MDDEPESAAPHALEDADGRLARRRWAHLPERVDPGQWVLTQPVDREPDPALDHELARSFLLWGAG